MKTCLLLGRKLMSNLQSILKSRDITLLIKVHIAKAMVFPVVMYGCENWTIKKAESWRIDAFKVWCWRRLLRVPHPARRSNESVLKKSTLNINCKDWCWSWNSNTLAIWCKELSHLERSWCWERLKKGEQQRIRLLDGIIDTMDMSLSKPWEMVKDGEARRAVVHDVTKSQMWLSDWTTYTCICMYL